MGVGAYWGVNRRRLRSWKGKIEGSLAKAKKNHAGELAWHPIVVSSEELTGGGNLGMKRVKIRGRTKQKEIQLVSVGMG